MSTPKMVLDDHQDFVHVKALLTHYMCGWMTVKHINICPGVMAIVFLYQVYLSTINHDRLFKLEAQSQLKSSIENKEWRAIQSLALNE